MATSRNKTPSEYGGRPGLIQRESDGHRLGPAGVDRDAVSEDAMLVRMAGMREAGAGETANPILGRPAVTEEEIRRRLENYGTPANPDYQVAPEVQEDV